MRICDIMSENVITVGQDEPVSAAARMLKQHNIGALPVCDSTEKLRGIVTDRDIVMRCVAPGHDPKQMRVSEVMTRGVITAEPDDGIGRAVRLMSEDQVRRLPIVDNGKLVGIVSLCDMARTDNCEMEASEALVEISSNIRRK